MASSKITTKDLSEPVVETLNTIDTVANQVSVVDSNVSTLLNRLSDTRAANLDLLNNSTYGLSALKTAIGKIPTNSSSGGYTIGTYVTTINSDTPSYTATKPVFIIKAGSGQVGQLNGNLISESYSPLLLGTGSTFAKGTSIYSYLVFNAVFE